MTLPKLWLLCAAATFAVGAALLALLALLPHSLSPWGHPYGAWFRMFTYHWQYPYQYWALMSAGFA